MFKTNKSIWGLLYSGSDFLGEAQILHLPTIVEKPKVKPSSEAITELPSVGKLK